MAGLELIRVDLGAGMSLGVPEGWELLATRAGVGPAVLAPARWRGPVPPAVVLRRDDEPLRGRRLAVELLAGAGRLDDGVVIDLRTDEQGRDADIVAAHRSQGVAVTTHERHLCHPGARWVVTFTARDRDWVQLAGVAAAVVASLEAVEVDG